MLRSTRPLVLAAALVAPVVPASATSGISSPAVVARELRTPRPDWYTEDLHRRVRAAGVRGVPLPAGAEHDVPVSGLAFTGIRPGSWMLSPSGCTMNFVFSDSAASAGRARRAGRATVPSTVSFDPARQLYIGTAGHCASAGEEVTVVAVAPGSTDPILVNVGRTVKSVDGGLGNDFALVEIRPELNAWVSPSMAHWGGPVGVHLGPDLVPVVHSGHGLLLGTGGTPRAGQLLYQEPDALYWVGGTVFGDSGSALDTASGLAAANITHLILDASRLGANSAGTRITRILQIAGRSLAICPSITPWPLPACPPA